MVNMQATEVTWLSLLGELQMRFIVTQVYSSHGRVKVQSFGNKGFSRPGTWKDRNFGHRDAPNDCHQLGFTVMWKNIESTQGVCIWNC